MMYSARSRRWAELVVLTSFAVTQPIFTAVGENATFLVAHDLRGPSLIAYALALSVIPAAVFIALDEVLVAAGGGRSAPLGSVLRGTILASIVAPPLNQAIGWDGVPSLIAFLGLVTVGSVIFMKLPVVQTAVRFALPAPIVFFVWFLFVSPASALVGEQGDVAVRSNSVKSTSVVWLIFDQLPLSLMIEPDGSIAEERFPHFAELARTSTWYPRATTVASDTGIAVPSSLSGTFVPSGTLPVVSATPVNLFTIFGGSHAIRATETFTQLCPDSLCRPAPEKSAPDLGSLWADTLIVLVRLLVPDAVADRLVPEINDRWADFGRVETEDIDLTIEGEATTYEEVQEHRTRGNDRALAENFLDGLRTSSEPTVHYLHIEKPHEPLLLLPDGRSFDPCTCFRVDEEEAWPEAPEMATQRLQQYLLQALYVDSFVGEVLDAMEASSLNDDAILVVMSDHGASLRPGSKNREIDAENVNDILPVPMFVRRPGQTVGGVDTRTTQLIDLLPTVVEELGLSSDDFDLDGVSLLQSPGADIDPRIITPQGVVAPPGDPDPTKSPLPVWIEDLFPMPSNPFQWGPHADLFGQESAGLAAGNSALEATIATLDRFSAVDPTGPYVPANVIGALHGSEEPVDLAVSVNGVIAGTGTTFLGDEWHITLMLDPAYLVSGENQLALYEITSDGLLLVRMR